MQWYDFVGSSYECVASLTFDTENVDKVTSVVGTHLSGKYHSDISALRIINQNLAYFPVNIEAYFPNLKIMQLYGNSITEVKNSHLAPFPNLVYLNLYTNKITSLDGSLFDGLNSMRYVSFERNNIRHVGHDLVLPKDGLIFFDANPCINVRASTPDQIAALRFNLLINCTLIEPIEAALGSRKNLLTDVSGQVKNLVQRLDILEPSHSKLNDDVTSLTGLATHLYNELQSISSEVRSALSDMENRFSYTTYKIENILTTMQYLLDKNAKLEQGQKLCEERLGIAG